MREAFVPFVRACAWVSLRACMRTSDWATLWKKAKAEAYAAKDGVTDQM